MDKPPLFCRNGKSPPLETNGVSLKMDIVSNHPPNEFQSLLTDAQLFSQMSIQHLEQVRQSVLRDNLIQDVTEPMQNLISAYEKISMKKWDAVRRVYEEGYRSSLTGAQQSMMGEDLKLKSPELSTKTPGKTFKKEEKTAHNGNALNPHDWIADAFRTGAFSSLEVTDGKDSFSFGECFPKLNNFSVSMNQPWAATLPPPGFGRADERDVEVSNHSASKSGNRDTTQSTSTPSEISSLHTNDDSCCSEESDGLSIDSAELCDTPSEENFDYVYTGGYVMMVSNGKETKGIVPKTVKRVLVDSSVTCIEEGAFQGCNALESVTIAYSVVKIGDNAFRKCSKLKSVLFLTRASKSLQRKSESKVNNEVRLEDLDGGNLPLTRASTPAPSTSSTLRISRIRTIGEWAFFNCSSLTSVNLPHGLERIGRRAFQRCSLLNLTEFPSTLTSVGENAFYGCPRTTIAALEPWERMRS